MFLRYFYFLLSQLGGAVLGALVAKAAGPGHTWIGVAAGLLLSGSLWMLIDSLRGARLLNWLRDASVSSSTPLLAFSGGAWGDVYDRVRRQLRNRDASIQASNARLQDFLAALQASPNGVVLLDFESRIEWFNQTAASHFGFEADRDLAQHISNLVRDPSFAAYVAGRNFEQDVVMRGSNDSMTRPVKVAVQLYPYGEGRLLLLSRDITALEQADVMRRDFVANVSHEIRTPLTVLAGFVETLQTLRLTKGECQHYLGLMAQQSERMQTLVVDLLMLSRLEGSPPVSAADWTPVQRLMDEVGDAVRGLSFVLKETGDIAHSLQFEVEEGVEIAGSQSELTSAMTNLACNAVRHTPVGGAIQIHWSLLADGRGEFSVRDTGPGIAAEHLPRLTERFYRVDRSRSRETGGTGLGLAIVKHVAQRHGAELRIASTPGVGSRFSIVFPASRLRKASLLGPESAS